MAFMSFLATQGFSQNTPVSDARKDSQNPQSTTSAVQGKFVDNNKDGICDNYQTRVKNGRSSNFVDKNGDGICDNRQKVGNAKSSSNNRGMGCQNRGGQGQGNGCGNGNGCQHRHGTRK